MKLIIAIVQDKDANVLQNEFVKHKIQVTKLPTKGGFLRAKNITFLIAIKDDEVQEVLDLIKTSSQTRKQFMTPPVGLGGGMSEASYPVEVEVGGATVIVLPIDEFYRF